MKKFSVSVLVMSALLNFGLQAECKPGKHKNKSGEKNQVSEAPGTAQRQAGVAEDHEPWLKVKLSIPEKGTLMRLADQIIALPRDNAPKAGSNLPPGLAKNVARGKRLPPGWQKKLNVGQAFPASLFGHTIELPPVILHELPPQPEGTILVTIGGKVVRLLEATKTIADVFDLKW